MISDINCNMPKFAIPRQLEYRDRLLPRIIRKNRNQRMAHIHQEFQKASKWIISINTSRLIQLIRKEAHLLSRSCCHTSNLDQKAETCCSIKVERGTSTNDLASVETYCPGWWIKIPPLYFRWQSLCLPCTWRTSHALQCVQT